MHNALADMYGPLFLLLYAGVIAGTCVVCRLALRGRDWTASLPPTAVPSSPDPYEIAYLRGGENELVRSVVFSLIQKGYLRVQQSGKEPLIERTAETPGRRALPPLERRVYDAFLMPLTARQLFHASGLPGQLKSFGSTYEERLRREHLLTPPDVRRAAVLIWLAGAAVITALGGYKLSVALAKGRSNVSFLIIMGAAALIVLAVACRVPRLSRKGRAYLERLQMAFERLKARIKEVKTSPATTAADMAAVDAAPLLLVGLFGVGALSGTAYDYYPQTFRQSAASSGGSCGGASCGSSGGDGGGGGSSCGGGSCGGGGCGGCGS